MLPVVQCLKIVLFHMSCPVFSCLKSEGKVSSYYSVLANSRNVKDFIFLPYSFLRGST